MSGILSLVRGRFLSGNVVAAAVALLQITAWPVTAWAAGELLWVQTSAMVWNKAIVTDVNDNVYVAGSRTDEQGRYFTIAKSIQRGRSNG